MHACMLRRDRSVTRLTLISELRAKVAEGAIAKRTTWTTINPAGENGVALRLDGNGRAMAIELT